MMDTAPLTLDRHLVGFVEALRRAGLAVPVGSTLDFGRAVAEVGAQEQAPVYWAGRVTLLSSPEEIPVYDEVFAAHGQGGDPQVQEVPDLPPLTLLLDDAGQAPDPEDSPEVSDDDLVSVRYSHAEVLASKDFAVCTDQELAELHQLMTQLRLTGSRRRSRRLRATQRSGRPDLRRTVRAALRTGGEPARLMFRQPGERPRRLVLLLDVSGSMEPYARALIRFVHAAMVGRSQVEAFALGTRLTRLTRELSTRDPDVALSRAAEVVNDWSGGTRLGDGLRCFNDEWGIRGMARGATVVILSDGWDRGEPEIMEEQMARLSRVAYQVVWVNPLKATPGYAPLAQGMAAALPHVDRFIAGHNLESLRYLAELVGE